LWIKKQSVGKTKIVELGRPRLPLHLFDLMITTPQYGLPSGKKIVHLPLPFVPARSAASRSLRDQWQHLPRPWIVAVIGGQKFPLRLGNTELMAFAAAVDRLAKAKSASVIVLASPRSPENALAIVSEKITQPHWQPSPGETNAYVAALMAGDMFCVTSDSVSMVAEMLETAKPVFVQPLPVSRVFAHWKADGGIPAALARKGILSPPRNTAGMIRQLIEQKIVGDLSTGVAPEATRLMLSEQEAAVQRVRSLIGL
jgi:uncharacterized protein